MLGFESLKTTKKDFQICFQSVLKSFKFFHHLLLSNSIFIALAILVEASYFYYLHKNFEQAPGGTPEAIIETYHILVTSLFSALQWTFLVFLVPFQLHNKHLQKSSPGPLSSFKEFLKENMWPVIIETMKAFFSILFYFISGLILALGITFGALSFGRFFSNSLPFSIPQDFLSIALLVLLFIVCLLPGAIKTVQYLFVPYIVFFSKQFKTSGESLKIASRISRGSVLPIVVIGALSTFLFTVIKSLIGVSWEKTLLQFTPHIIILSICLQLFYNILSTAFIHFMYLEKTNSYDENNRLI